MSTKSGLKKTFSWRFGPSKFTRKTKAETESEESDGRRHSYSFHSHQSTGAHSDSEPSEPSNSAKVSIGLISDILDGVVFAPVTSSLRQVVSQETQPDDKEYEMKGIGISANMAVLTLDNVSSYEPVNLLSAVKAMNETLDAVTDKKIGKQMCYVCEKSWKLHPELEVVFFNQCWLFATQQASQPSATASLIKQVWNLKKSIEKWDQKQLEDSGVFKILLSYISNSKLLACPDAQMPATVVQAKQLALKQ